MSEMHYIRCDCFSGMPRELCHYRADHRFVPSHPDAQTFEQDACGKHAAEYRDNPDWREVPLPAVTCYDLLHDLAEARETNTRLNRRCQEAEGALAEKIEKAARSGGSLGRSLANAAASSYKRERDEALGLLRTIVALWDQDYLHTAMDDPAPVTAAMRAAREAITKGGEE